MRIESLMTRDVSACAPDDTLATATRRMEVADCGCLPVVEPEPLVEPAEESAQKRGTVVGVLTDRDVCLAALREGKPLDAIPVRGAMSQKVYRCAPEQEVGEAERTMSRERVRRLPVVDAENRLVGMLSLADLAREAAREHGRPQRDLSDREIGDTLAQISRTG